MNSSTFLMPRGPMELLPQEALAAAFAQRLSEEELYCVLPRVSTWGQRLASAATKPATTLTIRSKDAVAGLTRWMQAHGRRARHLALTVQLHDAAARRPVWAALEQAARGVTRLQLSLPQGPDDEQLLLAVLAANPQLAALHLHHTRSAASATCFCTHFSPRLWQAACGLHELRLTGACVTSACSAGLPINTSLTCLEIGCCDTAAPGEALCALLESLPALRSLSYASGTPLQLTPAVSSRVAAAACNLTSLVLDNFHASGAEAQRGLQLLAGSLRGLAELRLVNCSGLEQLVQAPQPQLQQAGGMQGGLTRLAVTRSLQDSFLPGSLAWFAGGSDSDSDSSSSADSSSEETDSDDQDSDSCSVFGGAASSGSEAASAGWGSSGRSNSPSSCDSMAVAAPRGAAGASLWRHTRSSQACRGCGASPARGSQCCGAHARRPLSGWLAGLLQRGAALPALLELDLSGTGISTIAPLLHSCGLSQQLSALKLGTTATCGPRLGCRGLAGISSLQALRHVDLSFNRLCAASLQHLAGLTSISHLNLAGNHLAMCCSLQAAETGNAGRASSSEAARQCQLRPLASMAGSLQHLDISGCCVWTGAPTLAHLTNLTCLRAAGNAMQPAKGGAGVINASFLVPLHGLRELHLCSVEPGSHAGSLQHLRGLTRLVLQEPSAAASIFPGSLPRLQQLELVLACEQVAPVMRALPLSCSDLRSLSLQLQPCSPAPFGRWCGSSLASLAALTSLTALAVPVPADLRVLAGCTGLCRLRLVCPLGSLSAPPPAAACSPGSDCKPAGRACRPAPCAAGPCAPRSSQACGASTACCGEAGGSGCSDVLQGLQQLRCADWGPCSRCGQLQGMRCVSRDELVGLQQLRRLGSLALSHACLQDGAAEALPHVQILN